MPLWSAFVALLGVRWQASVPSQYFTGDVAGQLLVLRRKACEALRGDDFSVVNFYAYSEACQTAGIASAAETVLHVESKQAQAPQCQMATPWWLKAFFYVRPRGALHVNVPLTLGDERGNLAVVNTHLPQHSDNSALLWQLGNVTAAASQEAGALLAGDFNPLPDVPISVQMRPLLTTGSVPSHEPELEHCTWDLEQPLTREGCCNPRSMQLDFIFVQREWHSNDCLSTDLCVSPSCPLLCGPKLVQQEKLVGFELRALRTDVFKTPHFFVPGEPLSDHYGLLCELRVAQRA